MQTGTQRGMQTMEQSLSELTLRHVITLEDALSRSSRPDQLLGLLERAGFDTSSAYAEPEPTHDLSLQPLGGGLRIAEG
jgi:twitching motility protein PilT